MNDLRASVLIIEDDEPTQLLLRAIAARAGFAVTLAADGEAAMELLLSREFDVVLLDLYLPVKHGKDILRELAAARPQLLDRIIVVTAMHPDAYANCAEVARAWMAVRKPFDIDVLERALIDCLAARIAEEDPTFRSADAPHALTTNLRRVH